MALTSIHPNPPAALLELLQQRNWTALMSMLQDGFPPNAAWPGHGSLFERFVMASSLPERPLPGSIEHGTQMACLDAFIAAGLKPEPPIHGNPALSLPVTIACLLGRLDFLDRLLDAGHPADGLGTGEQSPLAVLACRRMSGEDNPINLSFVFIRPCVRRLLRAGASPHQPAENGWLPLQLATQAGDLGMMSMLLDAGANPNGKAPGKSDNPGPCFSPMAWAIHMDHPEALEMLLEKGGNLVGEGGLAGETLVEMAGRRCSTDVWHLLVNELGWAHEHVRRGWFKAIEANSTSVLSWFLAAGFDPTPLDPWGFSALDIATRAQALDATRLLATCGLASGRTDPDGLSPMLRARRAWGESVLQELGWKPSLRLVSDSDESPRHGPD